MAFSVSRWLIASQGALEDSRPWAVGDNAFGVKNSTRINYRWKMTRFWSHATVPAASPTSASVTATPAAYISAVGM